MHGSHFLKKICSTQIPIALSQGESERYALTHTVCAVIDLTTLSRDLGRDLAAHLVGDASAASGIGARGGVGKIRHLETRTLWLQKHIAGKEVTLRRKKVSENPSDLGTKCLDQAKMWKHVSALGYETRKLAGLSLV